jgi:hypothetical protein
MGIIINETNAPTTWYNIDEAKNVAINGSLSNDFLFKYQYDAKSPPIDKGVILEITTPILEPIIKCLILTF